MIRNKKFYIEAIKMDLYRIVYAAGDITKPLPKQSINEFLTHALRIFDKIESTPLEQELKKDLVKLAENLNKLEDPHKRLRWADNILTTRCRLG